MRYFDRYFFKIALHNILLAFVGVTLFFVAVDFFVNIDKFTEHGVDIWQMMSYFWFKTPPVLYVLAPLIVLLGGMFAVAQLVRHNEVVPLQIGGLRSSKIFRSFWAIALGCALLMLFAQEYVLPGLEERSMDVAASDIRGGIGEDLILSGDDGNVWYVRKFDVLADVPWLEGVNIIERDTFGSFKGRIYADRLEYTVEKWRGKYTRLDAQSIERPTSHQLEQNVAAGPLPEHVYVSPGFISREGKTTITKPVSHLFQLMRANPYRYDLELEFYLSFLYPLSCLTLLMIGVTIALSLKTQNFFYAGAITVAVAFAAFSLSFICEGLAKRDSLSPILASFGPALLLLGLGVYGLRYKAD